MHWVKAREDLLEAHAPGQLVIVRRPERKRLQLEIACKSRKAARALLEQFGGRVKELPHNWLNRFARACKGKPIQIGKRLIVAKPVNEPPGCSQAGDERNSVRRARSDSQTRADVKAQIGETQFLLIPASMAFGTGEHATTEIALRLLEKLTRHWKRGWSVVDLGTGSGILALAAKRFGAGHVVAIDVDPTAISIAKSNARLNQIHGVTFRLSDVRSWKWGDATDVITANLYSELLIEILPKLRRSGWLILSGILRSQETEFLRPLLRNNIEIMSIKRGGKWAAILARRRGPLEPWNLADGKFLRQLRTPSTVRTNAN
jgi:ribosomal protein L11 methyltransferase